MPVVFGRHPPKQAHGTVHNGCTLQAHASWEDQRRLSLSNPPSILHSETLAASLAIILEADHQKRTAFQVLIVLANNTQHNLHYNLHGIVEDKTDIFAFSDFLFSYFFF